MPQDEAEQAKANPAPNSLEPMLLSALVIVIQKLRIEAARIIPVNFFF
jgi:hypothetical protein